MEMRMVMMVMVVVMMMVRMMMTVRMLKMLILMLILTGRRWQDGCIKQLLHTNPTNQQKAFRRFYLCSPGTNHQCAFKSPFLSSPLRLTPTHPLSTLLSSSLWEKGNPGESQCLVLHGSSHFSTPAHMSGPLTLGSDSSTQILKMQLLAKVWSSAETFYQPFKSQTHYQRIVSLLGKFIFIR